MQDKYASARSSTNQLGKYRIRGLISRGSMGMVFHAYDPLLDRDVAIKVMVGASVLDEKMRARFAHEARAVARLHHPNIVTIHDLGYDQHGSPFIAMELLEGTDLDQLIEKNPPPLGRKLEIIAEVCRGLAHAHRHGIVHRDIKPANIFVADDGSVKIMDFGVARFTHTSQTQAGMVVGTAGYMSPEQLRAKKVDGRSDIFSLGIVLYEILTNQELFSGDVIEAVFFQTLNKGTPTLVMPDGTEIPTLQEILNRALAKDPDERYWGADEMEEEVQAFLDTQGWVVREKAFLKVRELDPAEPMLQVEGPSKEKQRAEAPSDTRYVGSGPTGQTNGIVAPTAHHETTPVSSNRTVRPRLSKTTIRRRARPRWLPLAVSVAVVLVALVGTYLWVLDRPGTVPFGATAASPDATSSVDPQTDEQPATIKKSDGNQGLPPSVVSSPGEGQGQVPEVSPREQAAVFAADAALALNRGDLEDAKSLIARGESLDPQSPRWRPLREQLRIQEVESQRRSRATNFIKEARRLLEAGSHQEAIDAYLKAVEYDPRNRSARRELDRAIELKRQSEKVVERPEIETRHFVESETEFVPAETNPRKVMGFEMEEQFNVKGTADPLLPAQLVIEFNPNDARPGEPYVLQVSVFNEGYRTIAFQSLELVSRYGQKTIGKGQQIPVRVRQVGPQTKAVLHEVTGTWTELRNHGEIEATVTLADGGKLIKNIRW